VPTYIVLGAGKDGKSPAYFQDLDAAMDFARSFAKIGIGTSVFSEIVRFTPEQEDR
jgi:hypothetical protein